MVLLTLSYSKFTESLPSPTHLCLFKAEPLVGSELAAFRKSHESYALALATVEAQGIAAR